MTGKPWSQVKKPAVIPASEFQFDPKALTCVCPEKQQLSYRGKAIYSHHMSVVEPVFGNLTSNKGLKRFSVRGKDKVQGQWHLYCLVHNIEKLQNYGSLGR